MKIAKAEITNFRKIEKLELDFTNSLGEVRDVTVIAGPNTCGKTTILDALAVCPGVSTELSFARPNFAISPRLVRRGEVHTRVTCWVRFTPAEIEATRKVFELAQEPRDIPDVNEVRVSWVYPDPKHRARMGFTECEPNNAWPLLKGRVQVARLLPTRLIDWSWFNRVGGIFTFDQQRTGMGRTIPRDIWNIINGAARIDEREESSRFTTDPQEILLALAVQSKFPVEGNGQIDQFRFIKESYDRLCAPHRLIGAVRDDLGKLDVRFTDGANEYFYEELSSGEEMLLLFLIRIVAEHIHHSTLLIDELELHQHPLWQRKLLDLLPKIGSGNQVIATTHSAYLRDALPPAAVIDLGDL